MHVTTHAIIRYKEHHPSAVTVDILEDWRAATPVPSETAAALTNKKPEWTATSEYRLSVHGLGLFAATGGAIMTYLRLSEAQEAMARRLWPEVYRAPAVAPEPVKPKREPVARAVVVQMPNERGAK